jgi:hypothetical protein
VLNSLQAVRLTVSTGIIPTRPHNSNTCSVSTQPLTLKQIAIVMPVRDVQLFRKTGHATGLLRQRAVQT